MAEEALANFREVGDEDAILWVTRSLAWTYEKTGELERALTLHKINIQRARSLGNAKAEAVFLGAAAAVATLAGDLPDGLSLLKQNLLAHDHLADPMDTSEYLSRAAFILGRCSEPSFDLVAVKLLGCAEAQRDRLGVATAWIVEMVHEASEDLRNRLPRTVFEEAWTEGAGLAPQEGLSLALRTLDGVS